MDQLQMAADARQLHLVLMPTEACNFRCTYCYEQPGGRRMTPAVVDAVERLLLEGLPELRVLILSWFGGEPLLARDVIERIMSRVGAAAARRGRPQLRADITTNGSLLTPACCERLLGLGITQFQVSLDGCRDWHDRTRVRKDGSGSYDRVWENLSAMSALPDPFQVVVRLHVHAGNAASVRRFLDDFTAAFGTDRRFRLFLRPLSCLQATRSSDVGYLRGQAGRRMIAALAARARQLGLAVMTPGDLQPVCYAARGNSLVVRADGRLAKCTVALDDPANDVGRVRADGTMELDLERTRLWMRGFASGRADQLRCPWRGLAPRPLTAAGALAARAS